MPVGVRSGLRRAARSHANTRRHASTRWSHIEQLPVAYDSPLFWSPDEVDELKGSSWRELALAYNDEVRSDWEALQTTLHAAAGAGGDTFLAKHAIDFDHGRPPSRCGILDSEHQKAKTSPSGR